MGGIGNIANSGLNAAMVNMQSISNNIANVNTPGFKKTYINFSDIQVNSGLGGQQAGLGVKINSIRQSFSPGRIESSENLLDLSIGNDGFFIEKNVNSGLVSYSRAGRIEQNNEGYLMGAGGRLQGYLASNGAILSSGTLADLKIPTAPIPAKATSNSNIAINLDARATIPTVPFSENDINSYNFRTDTTVYDSLGTPYSMALFYIKQSNNEWLAQASINNQNIGTGNVSFLDNGALSTTSGLDGLSWSPTNGASAPQLFSINLANSTQFSTDNTEYKNKADGYPSGSPIGFTVNNSGLLNVYYSNQESRVEGQIALARFTAPQGLAKTDNMSWIATKESGDAILSPDNSESAINTNSLELSNVDLTEELVKLIGAQHDFQANAQVQKTYNQLLQTIENL